MSIGQASGVSFSSSNSTTYACLEGRGQTPIWSFALLEQSPKTSDPKLRSPEFKWIKFFGLGCQQMRFREKPFSVEASFPKRVLLFLGDVTTSAVALSLAFYGTSAALAGGGGSNCRHVPEVLSSSPSGASLLYPFTPKVDK